MRPVVFIIFMIVQIFPLGLKAQQEKTALIYGSRYVGHFDYSHFYVLNSSQDTILNFPSEDFVGFEFKDFNKDGFKDIYLEWGGNMPDRYSVYVFVSSTGTFKE